ncbi:MAG: AAA family ATPase [Bacteroidaceae bacterium]|nr:AAA family ATPase [Bacteroidaceae bacterium]
MKKSIFFLKKLTSAEVGDTKTHEKYVRLPNDFDYESFFPGLAKENGNVIQVDFTAKNCTIGHATDPNIALKFVFYANSNHEKRIPSLSYVFTANNVQIDDVVCIESRTENGETAYYITFTKSDMASLNPTSVTYSIITEDTINEGGHKKQSLNLQQIYYGAPGTGKSHAINEKTEGESVIRTTFHPDSDYSTFVGAYKPTTKEVPLRDVTGKVVTELNTETGKVEKVIEDRIVYEFVEQAFLQAYIKAWEFIAENSDEPKKQYLVIEEINRGNCAQIFGDLFQLLDRNDCGFSDYPINADKDMKKQLKKAFNGLVINNANTINASFKGRDVVKEVLNGDILLLPNNLYIWATMNTSDQSLFPIDSAFKRRWEWQYMPIGKGFDESGREIKWAIEGVTKKYDWWSFLEKINAQIGEATQSEDKKLGFFFCKGTDGVISAEKFVGKVIFYLWNDVFKNNGFEGPIFKDVDGTELSFGKFYKSDSKGNAIVQKDKVELFLNNLGVQVASTNNPIDDTLPEVDEDGNNASSATKDFSKYAINGNGAYSKGSVVLEAMKLYIANNPNKDAISIVNDWLALGVNVPNFVETEAMFIERKQKSKDSRINEKAKTTTLSNGETLYVSNQYNPERMSDVISKVNAANWNITISKV